jgi:hypothetical protein
MKVVKLATNLRRTSLRHAIAVLARLLVAVVVVCGVTQSGARYFYCEALGLSITDPCVCPAEHRGTECPVQFEPRPVDCCKVVRLPVVPRAARLAEAGIEPSPWVALLPPLHGSRGLDGFAEPPPRRVLQRWRAPPRTSERVHEQVSVFLT